LKDIPYKDGAGNIGKAKKVGSRGKVEDFRNRRIFDPLPLEFISDVLWTMNADLRLTFASPSIYDLLGYTSEEACGMELAEFLTPDSHEAAMREYENENNRYRSGGFVRNTTRTLEFQLKHKLGHSIECEIKLTIVRDRNGAIKEIVGVTRDVTRRKEIEKANRGFQEKLERIFHNLPVLIMALDRDDNIIAWNDACRCVTGYAADEIIGNKGALKMLFADTDYREQVLKGNSGAGHDYRVGHCPIIRKDGSERIIEWWNISSSHQIPGWADWVVGIDATERIKAEQNLRQSEEQLRAHYKAFPMATYTWQRRGDDFYLIDFNDAAMNITEGKIADYLGISLSELYRDSPHIVADLRECYDKKSPVKREYEYRYKSTGKVKDLAVTYVYAPEDMVVVYTDDITQQKQGMRAITESENRYNTLFNSVLEGLGVVDEREIISYCNPAFAGIFEEKSPEAMVGKSLADYLDDDQLELIKQQTAERRNGVSSQYELSIKTARGNRKTILVSASPRITPDGRYTGAFGAILDITGLVKSRFIGQARLNLLNNLRSAKTIDECLELGCRAIKEGRRFRRAVMTFHNEKREITNLGQVGLDKEIIERARRAPAPDLSLAKAMTDERFKISRSYFIPEEAGFDYKATGRFIPQAAVPAKGKNSWRSGDEFFSPIIDDSGHIEGWLSVDDPFDGTRPDLETAEFLEEVIDIVCKKTHEIISRERLAKEHEALIEANIALKEVLSFIEKEKKEIKNQLANDIDQVLLPTLKRVMNSDGSINMAYYTLLKNQLQEMAASAGGVGRLYSKLTPREVEICSLIKSGYTSKEISRSLSLTVGTVSKHREMIRKKLGLANKGTNLIQFLKNN